MVHSAIALLGFDEDGTQKFIKRFESEDSLKVSFSSDKSVAESIPWTFRGFMQLPARCGTLHSGNLLKICRDIRTNYLLFVRSTLWLRTDWIFSILRQAKRKEQRAYVIVLDVVFSLFHYFL